MPGIFKNMASKHDEKEEAIALEIQSDALLILSGLCEHYIQRKVCDPCEPAVHKWFFFFLIVSNMGCWDGSAVKHTAAVKHSAAKPAVKHTAAAKHTAAKPGN